MVTVLHNIRSAIGKVRLLDNPQPRPTSIANFAVTYRCTSRCKTCNIWRIDAPERGELTLDEVKWLFKSNRDFLRDVRSIQITGGEPFMRLDLPELVSAIHEALPRCVFGIPTNGLAPTRIENATEALIEYLGSHNIGVSISIDGLEMTHDAIRGIEGSFERAVETLRRLSALRGDYPDLRLAVGMTLTSENYGELLEVFRLARRHGAGFSFRPVNYSEIYYRNTRDEVTMKEAKGELLPAIQKLGRAVVDRYGFLASAATLRYFQGALDYIRDPWSRWLRCSAGSDSLFLDPYGNVYPCLFLDERMGNVRERPMEEMWASEEASRCRARIRSGDCPGCWVECEAYRDIHKDLIGLASVALRAFLHPNTAGIR